MTMCNENTTSSLYTRAWQYVQRRLHLRSRAGSYPADVSNRAAISNVPDSPVWNLEWQRVHMLKELETCQECSQETAEWTPTEPKFRTQAQRKAAQTTCCNCGLLFFRLLSVAQDTGAFCGRDCQSTFEFRRGVQNVVRECVTARNTVNWTQSSAL